MANAGRPPPSGAPGFWETKESRLTQRLRSVSSQWPVSRSVLSGEQCSTLASVHTQLYWSCESPALISPRAEALCLMYWPTQMQLLCMPLFLTFRICLEPSLQQVMVLLRALQQMQSQPLEAPLGSRYESLVVKAGVQRIREQLEAMKETAVFSLDSSPGTTEFGPLLPGQRWGQAGHHHPHFIRPLSQYIGPHPEVRASDSPGRLPLHSGKLYFKIAHSNPEAPVLPAAAGRVKSSNSLVRHGCVCHHCIGSQVCERGGRERSRSSWTAGRAPCERLRFWTLALASPQCWPHC